MKSVNEHGVRIADRNKELDCKQNCFEASNLSSQFAKFEGKEDHDKTVDSKKERRVEIQTERKACSNHTDRKYSFKQSNVMSNKIENCVWYHSKQY